MAPVNNRQNYKYQAKCKICSATDRRGTQIRDEIDGLLATGVPYHRIKERLLMEGISVTDKGIGNHVNKHAQYIKVALSLGTKTSNQMRMHIHQEMVEASTTLNKIVGIGDQMIENWVNGETGLPQMPVTERLFIEALKEQGRRGVKTTLDVEMEGMDREMIEGKPKTKPIKVTEPPKVVEGEVHDQTTP